MFYFTRVSFSLNVVLIGTGWAGAYFAKRFNPTLANLHVLSTRNHHVFTPLLPQTTTGTLEFRAVCEPISNIQHALAQHPNSFSHCVVHNVDFDKKEVNCVGVGVINADLYAPVKAFNIKYDKLVLAHGAEPNTFNVPGVKENAFFLREVNEARAIRKRLIQNIMVADLPTTSVEEIKRLLHTVVVGGGPTGIEFAAAVTDFVRDDVHKNNPHLVKYCRVTVLEAGELFVTFDMHVRKWGVRRLKTLGVEIVKDSVVAVTDKEVLTKSGKRFSAGLVVWSTGVGPSTLTKTLDVDRTPTGRISVDPFLRVFRNGEALPDVFALGDCAANKELPLPTLAAVASRQGTYLASALNRELANQPFGPAFEYKSLGSMLTIGEKSAIVELHGKRNIDFVGLKAIFFWRSAYLSILGSWRNKLYVIMNWLGSKIYGRDVTFFNDLSEERVWRALAARGISREPSLGETVAEMKSMETRPAVGDVSVVTECPSSSIEAAKPNDSRQQ